MIEIVNDSILNSKEQYIAHQCNCVTKNSLGLAKLLFETYPWSNVYLNRDKPDKPGTVKISYNPNNNNGPHIINMFAQFIPGKSRTFDEEYRRLSYFKSCMTSIFDNIPDLKSIAFPFGIGCGLAGGDWNKYYQIIQEFAEKYENVSIKIYKI